MAYEAWRHEPKTGPSILHSRTVFEDASPDLVRDFFWNDEFRPKWDPMLTLKLSWNALILGLQLSIGSRSDREYIIVKRIWEAGKTLLCNKGCFPSHPSIQKRNKPRRVDLYFSSWVINPGMQINFRSLRGDGQYTACDVSFVHYEDMGIPKDFAMLRVSHGMWGTVQNLGSVPKCLEIGSVSVKVCPMARITTKISSDGNPESLGMVTGDDDDRRDQTTEVTRQGENGIDWKWVVLGGTVAVIFGLHAGGIGGMLLVGAGRRVARR